MESLVVRPAQAGDAADLARNWLEAARHYAGLDTDAFQVPAADGLVEWFEELLGRPRSDDAVWLVAEVGDRVVGDVAARLEPPVEDAPRQLLRDLGRVRLRVDALAVKEAYRRRSIVFEKRLDYGVLSPRCSDIGAHPPLTPNGDASFALTAKSRRKDASP